MTVGDLRGSGKKEQHYARALRDGRFAGAILFTGRIPRDGSDDARLSFDIPIVLACNEISGLSTSRFSMSTTAKRRPKWSPT